MTKPLTAPQKPLSVTEEIALELSDLVHRTTTVHDGRFQGHPALGAGYALSWRSGLTAISLSEEEEREILEDEDLMDMVAASRSEVARGESVSPEEIRQVIAERRRAVGS